MNLILKKNNILAIILWICFVDLYGQSNVPQGVNLQAVARNSSGVLISNQSISVKIGIRSGSAAGLLEWEETHVTSTNQFGLFNIVIGQGISTGAGALNSFSVIPWSAANHFVVTSIDPTGGISYVDIDTMQLWAVPYAFHAATSNQPSNSLRLNDLIDVDTSGVINGFVLKWAGTAWVPSPDNDSDTVSFAWNSDHSNHSDTATYSINQLSQVDTVPHSINADTAQYALNSVSSLNAISSGYCDTAIYALNTGNLITYWNLNGNSGTNTTNFIGTTDASDLIFKTSNIERLRVLSNGKIGVGISSPAASFQINGNDGLLASGNVGAGIPISMGAGTRMHWYPKKGAFRVGFASGTQWDDSNIGLYSFAAGNSNTASGAYSTALGQISTSTGANSIAMGYGCNGGNESAVALGSICSATGVYSVALGRGIISSDSSSVGIGYHSNATGKYSLALGAYTTASGNYSTTMGWYANSNGKKGSFVYADNSSTAVTNSTADNQFVVRASGGIVFYSNSTITTGVSIPSGGGSWASVSDKNKKENFKIVDGDQIIKGIEKIEVNAWNYKTQASNIQHIGPTAQDFYAIFGYGESDTTITSVDIDGVNLMALKTLALKTKELKESAAELELLKQKIQKIEKEKELLEKRITSMEQKMKATTEVIITSSVKQ